ncbi:MAG: hypothetical protein ABIG64_05810 [Candidatus Omnitrophota bacterium]
MRECFFVGNSSIGDFGLSGGDRIFVELARNWQNKIKLTLIGSEETISICKREGLSNIEFLKTSGKFLKGQEKEVFTLRAIFGNFFIKLGRGILFVIKNRKLFRDSTIIYSVSDFYPDSIPAFLIKIMNRKVFWIASFYLFAPVPWQKDNPYKGRNAGRGFLYWLSQIPIYWIINIFADVVFVTSLPDQKKFVTKKRNKSKVLVIRGGVDIAESEKYLNSDKIIAFDARKYDACFVGRFHHQKGVLVLVDIWGKVVKLKSNARLAMVGNGSLEAEVKKKN